MAKVDTSPLVPLRGIGLPLVGYRATRFSRCFGFRFPFFMVVSDGSFEVSVSDEPVIKAAPCRKAVTQVHGITVARRQLFHTPCGAPVRSPEVR